MNAALLPFLLLPSAFPTGQAATLPEGQKERLDVLLEKEMREAKLAGLAVAVLRNGDVRYRRCLGFADVEAMRAVTPGTPFNLASVTKIFTSVALMKLVEGGRVSLDAPISRYLESAPRSWSGITVRHLLTHSSGIPDYTKYPSFRQVYMNEISREAVLKCAMESPLEFEPGAKSAYSNTGYVVLGHLIAAASGGSYIDFLRRGVLQPVGMKNASLDEPGKAKREKAKPYELANDSLVPASEVAKAWSFAAGGLNASLNDLVEWDKAVAKRMLLKRQSWDALWKSETTNLDGRGFDYGLGWVVSKVDGKRVVGHFGDKPGYSALYLHFPDTGLALIVLANRTNANAFGIGQRIYSALDPAE